MQEKPCIICKQIRKYPSCVDMRTVNEICYACITDVADIYDAMGISDITVDEFIEKVYGEH